MDDDLIVAGYDGSPDAQAAVRHALLDAARRGGRVRVVSVFRQDAHAAEILELTVHVELPHVAARLETQAHACVREILAAEPCLAGVPVEVRAVHGRPAAVLVDEARDAAGLVLGRGRGAATWAGSVALRCLHRAPCPVTVVRAARGTAAPRVRRRRRGEGPAGCGRSPAVPGVGRLRTSSSDPDRSQEEEQP